MSWPLCGRDIHVTCSGAAFLGSGANSSSSRWLFDKKGVDDEYSFLMSSSSLWYALSRSALLLGSKAVIDEADDPCPDRGLSWFRNWS